MGINTTLPSQDDERGALWPALPYQAWQETRETLHMWTQIVGKVKLELVPFLNEWWEVGFTVTARGLTSATIPFGDRIFQVDFDFLDHRVDVVTVDGAKRTIELVAMPVADFYAGGHVDARRPRRRDRHLGDTGRDRGRGAVRRGSGSRQLRRRCGPPVLARARRDGAGAEGLPRQVRRQVQSRAPVLGIARSRTHGSRDERRRYIRVVPRTAAPT